MRSESSVVPPAMDRHAIRLYTDANDAYHDGRYPEAVEQFRKLVELRPDFPKALPKLIGLLAHRADTHMEKGAHQDALPLYHEAMLRSAPDTSPHLVQSFNHCALLLLREQFAEGNLESATQLVDEFEFVGSGEPELEAAAALCTRISHRLSSPDRFSYPKPFSNPGPILILIEPDADCDLLSAQFSALVQTPDQVECYALHRMSSLPTTMGELPVTGAGDLVDTGLGDDSALFDEAAEAANRMLLPALKRLIPRRLQSAAGINILDHLSFRIEDEVYSAARKLHGLERLITSSRFEAILCVTGSGQLTDALSPLVAQHFQSDDIHHLWASTAAQRFDTTPANGFPQPIHDHTRIDESGGSSIRHVVRLKNALSPIYSRLARPRQQRPPRHLLPTRACDAELILLPHPLYVQQAAQLVQALGDSTSLRILPIRPDHPTYDVLRAFLDTPSVAIEFETETLRILQDRQLAAGASGRGRAELAFREITQHFERTPPTLRNIDIWPIVRDRMQIHVTETLPALRSFARTWKSHVQETRPDVLVLLQDRLPQWRIVCTLSRQAGIPTIRVLPFFMSANSRYKPPQADYITVPDVWTRELLEEHFNVPGARVFVTGIPRFDAILERRKTRHQIGVIPEAARLDVATQTNPGMILVILQRVSPELNRKLIDVAARGTEASGRRSQIVVKLHYSDSKSRLREYEQYIAECYPKTDFKVVKDDDLYDLVESSDLVITMFSNVALEAAMLDRLVLCVNLSDGPPPVPFVDEGVGIGADTVADAIEQTRCLLMDGEAQVQARLNQQRYFARNPHLLSRPAAEQVADAIVKVAEAGRTRRA